MRWFTIKLTGIADRKGEGMERDNTTVIVAKTFTELLKDVSPWIQKVC